MLAHIRSALLAGGGRRQARSAGRYQHHATAIQASWRGVKSGEFILRFGVFARDRLY